MKKRPRREDGSSVTSDGKYSTSYFKRILEHLKGNRHEKSTKKNYHGIWTKFNQFVISLDHIPKKWEEKLTYYCAYMVYVKRLKSATIRSYVSAIKQTLLDDGYEWDNQLFLLATFVQNCEKDNNTLKPRLPIKKNLMEMILCEVERKYREQPYLETLYKTVFIVAYYGLLRVGELAISEHTVRAHNVHCNKEEQKILILLQSSKTHKRGQPLQEVQIKGRLSSSEAPTMFCPFEIFQEYLDIRPGSNKTGRDKRELFTH